jgi:hypothetical protein
MNQFKFRVCGILLIKSGSGEPEGRAGFVPEYFQV